MALRMLRYARQLHYRCLKFCSPGFVQPCLLRGLSMSKSHKTRVQVVRETTTLSFYDIVLSVSKRITNAEEGWDKACHPSHLLYGVQWPVPSMQTSLWIHTSWCYMVHRPGRIVRGSCTQISLFSSSIFRPRYQMLCRC